MDLFELPARLVGRYAAKFFGDDGRNDEERVANLREDAFRPVTDEADFVLRHLTRFFTWWTAGFFYLPVIVVSEIAMLLTVGHQIEVVGYVTWSPLAFMMWLGAIHGVKFLVAHYLFPEGWHPNTRLRHLLTMSQVPDILLSIPLTWLFLR